MINDIIRKVIFPLTGILALTYVGCKGQEEPVQTDEDPLEYFLEEERQEVENPECDVDFAGYTGMCKGEAFDGSIILVKEYSNRTFDFFRDTDNDGCFDTKGNGFYMFGISERLQEKELPQGKYCLEE